MITIYFCFVSVCASVFVFSVNGYEKRDSPPKFGLNRMSYPSNIRAIVCVTFSTRLAAKLLLVVVLLWWFFFWLILWQNAWNDKWEKNLFSLCFYVFFWFCYFLHVNFILKAEMNPFCIIIRVPFVGSSSVFELEIEEYFMVMGK